MKYTAEQFAAAMNQGGITSYASLARAITGNPKAKTSPEFAAQANAVGIVFAKPVKADKPAKVEKPVATVAKATKVKAPKAKKPAKVAKVEKPAEIARDGNPIPFRGKYGKGYKALVGKTLTVPQALALVKQATHGTPEAAKAMLGVLRNPGQFSNRGKCECAVYAARIAANIAAKAKGEGRKNVKRGEDRVEIRFLSMTPDPNIRRPDVKVAAPAAAE